MCPPVSLSPARDFDFDFDFDSDFADNLSRTELY